jgi:hypothetical protein
MGGCFKGMGRQEAEERRMSVGASSVGKRGGFMSHRRMLPLAVTSVAAELRKGNFTGDLSVAELGRQEPAVPPLSGDDLAIALACVGIILS